MPDIIIDPVVVPAKPEKTYDKGWVSQLVINAPLPSDPIKVSYMVLPYDGNGNVLKDGNRRIIPDVAALLPTHPKLALAYQAIIEAVTEFEASLLKP